MKITTIALIIFCLACVLEAEPASFEQLDKNQDGTLSIKEIPKVNLTAVDHADQDIDRVLNEKEYKDYLNFIQRISQERSTVAEGTTAHYDLPYVEGRHYRQKLDLYIPDNVKGPLPLVIWIHGGGWRRGDKGMIARQLFLLEHGFAFASINYRLSHNAKFPAQIHDCKAAIRYLRKHAGKYGLDPNRIGVWGSSAGGHLVALVGTSGDVKRLEGKLGETGVSSRVQAVCDFFGPTDFWELRDRPPNPNLKTDDPRMQTIPRLLGGLVTEKKALARLASPASHVTKDDPPFLIMHGDADPLVPHQQSELLHGLLVKAGVDSTLVIVPGHGHGFFKEAEQLQFVKDFFERAL